MKSLIGFALIVLGVLGGVYVCVWVCFIGGIVDVIEQIRSVDMSAMAIALGIAKVVFSGLAGWVSAVILVIPGCAMLEG